MTTMNVGYGHEGIGHRAARRSGWLALLLAVLVPGCAASSSSPTMAPIVSDSVMAPAPPPPPGAVASAPTDRPGLGTEWGEDRDSRIEEVAFNRADTARPVATAELRYDDERGVEALASYVADHTRRNHETGVAGGNVAVWLKDGHDNPLDFVDVAGRTFVVGESGERYTIVLENRSPHRLEVVSTVDGLDVMTGKPGSLRNRGYVLDPFATVEIDGFRESESTVAAFRFGRVKDAYAAKQGSARNVGVIGLALFSERGDGWTPWSHDEVERRLSAQPFPADTRFATPPRW